MLYKIYKLLFPGGEVYIGKTYTTLDERWAYGKKYHKGTSVREAIDKYGWENVQTFLLCDNLTYEEANKLEKEEVDKHGGINHPLVLNDRDGGDAGWTFSDSVKEKMSNKMNQRYNDNPELLTQVDQYSYDGEFIATYPSLIEAEKVTGILYQNISACINGKRTFANGYRWIKHGKHFGIIQYPLIGVYAKKAVNQIDPNTGYIIATYESLLSAAKSTGIPIQNISKCLQGKRHIAGGYIWQKVG